MPIQSSKALDLPKAPPRKSWPSRVSTLTRICRTLKVCRKACPLVTDFPPVVTKSEHIRPHWLLQSARKSVVPNVRIWNPSRASDLALVHARIYPLPTEPAVEDGTILVHDGRITAVGPSATTKPRRFARAVTVIDCKGLVITAGFWNSHVHIFTPRLLHAEDLSSSELSSQLEKMLTRCGFTSVVDIASVLDNTTPSAGASIQAKCAVRVFSQSASLFTQRVGLPFTNPARKASALMPGMDSAMM
jgi:hypothetical protein